MADSLLKNDWYHPQFSSDIWQLGQLMLEMTGGVIPAAQSHLQDCNEYDEEVQNGMIATKAPAMRKHLVYLRDCLTSETDYAAEVCVDYCSGNHADHSFSMQHAYIQPRCGVHYSPHAFDCLTY